MTNSTNPEVLAAQVETLNVKLELKEKELAEKQNYITQLYNENAELKGKVSDLEKWQKRVIKDFNIPMG